MPHFQMNVAESGCDVMILFTFFFYKFNSLVITMNPLTQTTPLNFTYWKPFGGCQNEMCQLFCFTEYPLTLASQEDILSIDSLSKLMRYLEYVYS